jgi:Tfp pilus assembly protein PilF
MWRKAIPVAAALWYSAGSAAASPIENCFSKNPFKQPDSTLTACQAIDGSKLDKAAQAKLNYQIGAAYYWNVDFGSASQYLENAIELDNKLIVARIRNAWNHKAMGDFQRAFDEFETVLAIDPKNARAVFGIGFIYGVIGETEKKLTAYKQSVELDPNYYYGRAALIQLEYQLELRIVR